MANLIGLVVCTGNAFSPVVAVKTKQPNLVIIMAGDLGHGDLTTYGHQIVRTPNTDRLAREGVKFTDYYALVPLSSPSRAGLLTGRMPFRTDIRSWIPMGKDVVLGRGELTTANLLKAQGYDIAMVGKLYLNAGGDHTDQPQAKDTGFDCSLANTAGLVTDTTLDNVKEHPRYGMVYPVGWLRNGQLTPRADKMSGEYVSSEIANWLDNKEDSKPFFSHVASTEVHSPPASPKKYLGMHSQYISAYQRQHPGLFYSDWVDKPWHGVGGCHANTSYLDVQVGKVLDKIEAMGEEDNTVVIFTSDNGPVVHEARRVHGLNLAGETDGLHGRKDNLRGGGIHIPAAIKYGKHLPQGIASDTPVYGLDWMPTLAKITSFKLPTDHTFDGELLVPVPKQKTLKRGKSLIFGIDTSSRNNPTGEWAIRNGGWKMIIDRNNKPKYLYNLKPDRYEALSLIGKKPDIERQIYGKFLKYKTDTDNNSLMKARGGKSGAVTWG